MSKLDQKAGGIKSPEAAQRSPTQTAEERRYKAEEALHTMRRHNEILEDKQLCADARALAKTQMTHLAKIANAADGATARKGSEGAAGKSGATKSSPPTAAKRSGDKGGGGSGKGGAGGKSK